MEKRYEYWGMVDGKPVKMFTDWYPWKGELYKFQLKSSKLYNEYRESSC